MRFLFATGLTLGLLIAGSASADPPRPRRPRRLLRSHRRWRRRHPQLPSSRRKILAKMEAGTTAAPTRR